jgi:hypothetical protein
MVVPLPTPHGQPDPVLIIDDVAPLNPYRDERLQLDKLDAAVDRDILQVLGALHLVVKEVIAEGAQEDDARGVDGWGWRWAMPGHAESIAGRAVTLHCTYGKAARRLMAGASSSVIPRERSGIAKMLY